MAAWSYVLLSSLAFVCLGWGDIVYPVHYEQDKLATRINCQVGESRSFSYSSVTKLWGKVQGQISVDVEVTVYCLGNDIGGTYGAEGLKYFVDLSSLRIAENSSEEPQQRLVSLAAIRHKRGVVDFLRNTWTKIKNFVGRIFGKGSSEGGKSSDEGRRETEVENTEDVDGEAAESAEEEDTGASSLNYESLYSLPFEFVQLANGTIPEVRFAEEERDGRIRNFKRHLVDSFATQLTTKPEMTKETSVIGEHLTNYSIRIGTDAVPDRLTGLAGAVTSPLVNQKEGFFGENHVLVEKLITEDDILNLATSQQSEALNDRDKMGLKAEQRQLFVSGKLISSSGKSSISLFDPVEKRRTKRSVEDVMSYFQAESAFDLKLEKRKRRSVSLENLQKLQEKSMKFKAASRFAEVEDTSAKQELRKFQESIGNPEEFVRELLENPPTDGEKMQRVFEAIQEEIKLGEDHGSRSMAAAIRTTVTQSKVLPKCRRDFNSCRDFLQLLSLAGGSKAEKVLLACLSDSHLDLLSRQQVADILSEMSNPSDEFVSTIIMHVEDAALRPELRGTLCLSAATIASRSQNKLRQTKMAEVLVAMLDKEHSNGCSPGPLTLDILEALGNLGHNDTVDHIWKVSEVCANREEIQIACAHAFRHLATIPQVQNWCLKALNSGSCDVSRAVLGSLLDKIASQEKARDMENWPRNGFNNIDEAVKSKLSSSPDDFRCALEDAARYFRKKKDPRAKAMIKEFFSDGAEPWNPGTGSRQKRDLWDKLNCQEWTEDNVYRPIQDKEEFESDRATYNRRKSCLASKKLGLRGANAEIYAGMFAGVKEPSEPREYKLFTKFVCGLNFLGHQMELGSFYFYHRSGNTKAYVRIMGRTRQEFTHEGCTPTELRYRPITHVPLFLVTISAVQLSLGIHLSSQLSLDTQCPKDDVYNLQPLSTVRVGGEALGTVLFLRGALNLGGNFNYHLQFTFVPSPDMCLEGYHGNDPMSISLEAYYQAWNVIKRDWGKHRTWRPNTLKWQVTGGRHQQWFNNTCILKVPVSRPESRAPSTPSNENDIVIREQ